MPNPAFPIGVWFPPPENFAAWKARGCNFVLGPELGNPQRMTPLIWTAKAFDPGLAVVGNFEYRPPNLLAWFVPIDEPNAHNIPIAQVKAYVDKFTALDPTVPIVISLAGDQISNDDAGKTVPYYAALAALSPRIVFLVNYYVCNRNPERYLPLHLNARVIVRLRNWLIGTLARPIWLAVECSWQRLDAQQPQGRCPTADEMEGQINEAIAAGAAGLVYFATATKNATIEGGKPGPPDPGWPARYDPPVDVSIPQRMVQIAARLNPAPLPPPPPPAPTLEQRLAKAEAWMASASDELAANTRTISGLVARVDAMVRAGTVEK